MVLFPDSNLQSSKRRPALVVQANGLPTSLPQMVVALISSNVARWPAVSNSRSSRVALSRGTGLRADSVIMIDNLATVLNSLVDRKIGVFSDMSVVNAAIRITLNV